jgi:SAM-dependent methyltransferase
MSNPWLSIPLADYEGHMSAEGVQQLGAVADLFKSALSYCCPRSVAVLGVAGGNGLEQIDSAVTRRIVGIDINQSYLDEVRHRFNTLADLELHCRELGGRQLDLAPVELVHAALIFEHTGLDRALENALSLVAPGGRFSVVLQLPSLEEQDIAPTQYTSMQALKHCFTLIDIAELQSLLKKKEFQLVTHQARSLAAGKALWMGIFAKAIGMTANNP